MAKKFSARWKATGFLPGDSTQFVLSGDIPESMAVRISKVFFQCYRDEMAKTYQGRNVKPKARKLCDPKQHHIRLSIDAKNSQTEACDGSEDVWMGHVGKKAAGRQLDGREWNQFPSPL
jgi:hypothetical protein